MDTSPHCIEEVDMKTFTFTIEQIKEIYAAGIERGRDEATAEDWGSPTWGEKYDECVDVMARIVNAGKNGDDPEHVDFAVIREWFK
jgi:hypothetical protein